MTNTPPQHLLEPAPDPDATHVRLLAGHGSRGNPVFEVLPAHDLGGGLFELDGSPGLVLGCAAGDVLHLDPDGGFTVRRQGGNHCVQAGAEGPFTAAAVADLTAAVADLGGITEAPADLRFVVVTIPRSAQPSAVARVMDQWSRGVPGAQWWFGNADQAGEP